MIQPTITKIEVVDVESGATLDMKIKRRRATRSKNDEKKKKLLYGILFGRQNIEEFKSSYSFSQATLDIIFEFASGTNGDIDYLASTMIKARDEGLSRDILLAALVILSLPDIPYAKEVFRKTFPLIVTSLEDVDTILSIVKAKTFRGFGKVLQKSINAFVNKLSTYELLDYMDKGVGTSSSFFKLKDIIRFCHTKPASETQEAIFIYAIKKLVTRKLPKIFLAWEDLVKESNNEKAIDIIKNNNFPIEIIKRKYPRNAAIFNSILESTTLKDIMSFFVTSSGTVTDEMLDRLLLMVRDEKIIEASGLTPFHLLKFYDEFKHHDIMKERRVKRSIERAIEYSFKNVPTINGSFVIVLDQSQAWGNSHDFSSVIPDSASLAGFAAIFSKLAKDSYIISITRKPSVLKFRKEDSVIDIIDQIIAQDKGGEINYRDGIKLLSSIGKVDNVLAISCASWYSLLRQTQTGNALSEYLSSIGSDYSTRLAFWSSVDQNATIQNMRNTVFVSGKDYYTLDFLINYLTKKIN